MVCSCPDLFVFNPKLSSPLLIILNPVIPQDIGLLYQNILQGILVLREAFRGKLFGNSTSA